MDVEEPLGVGADKKVYEDKVKPERMDYLS